MALHCNVERGADFTHAIVAEPSETLDQDSERHALDRVQVDRGSARNWIATLLQYDLARQAADRGRTGCDQRAFQPWNGCVTREHHDWPSADIRQLAPPHLSARRQRAHAQDAEAASRNDARSPHASASSGGCAS
jgi:hypothetical protein